MRETSHSAIRPPKIGKSAHPDYPWRVHFTERGKRRSKFFKSEAKAKAFVRELNRELAAGGSDNPITLAERSAVVGYRSDLERLRLPIDEALRFAVDAFEDAPLPPSELLDIGRRQAAAMDRAANVSEVAADLLKAKERAKKSDRYLYDLRKTCERFEKHFGNRNIATIEPQEIEDWLHATWTNATTIKSGHSRVSVLFGHAVRRGWIEANPMARVERVKPVLDEVEVLTAEQMHALLVAADPQVRAVFVLGGFLGIRDAELKRLEWSDVLSDSVRITSGNAKTAARRVVSMSENAQEWMETVPRGTGKVYPERLRKLYRAARRKAGFGKLTPWPKNALRHSFGSYHLAAFENAAETALQMGHVDAKMVFRHYRAVVTKQTALKWWEVRP